MSRSRSVKKQFKVATFIGNGLFVALCVVLAQYVVDRLKTADERRYRDRIDLESERTKNVPQLLPILYDENQPIIIKAELLARLMNRGLVTDPSALVLTERVVADTVSLPANDRSTGDAKKLLVQAWLGRAPQALGDFMEHVSTLDLDSIRARPWLWPEIFSQAIARASDKELSLLNDDAFVIRYLSTMWSLSRTAGIGESTPREWFARPLKGLRVLGALWLWQSADSAGALRIDDRQLGLQAKSYIFGIMDPAQLTPENLDLARAMVQSFLDSGLHRRDVSERCIQFIDRNRRVKSYHEEDVRMAMLNYLSAQDFADLEDMIIPVLRREIAQLDDKQPLGEYPPGLDNVSLQYFPINTLANFVLAQGDRLSLSMDEIAVLQMLDHLPAERVGYKQEIEHLLQKQTVK